MTSVDEKDIKQVEATAIASAVGNVSLKLPPFAVETQEAWWEVAEAQFTLRGITSPATKYCHIISVLPADVQRQVLDILTSPVLAKDKYELIKTRLQDTYGMADLDKARQAMDTAPMAEDERPSLYINNWSARLGSIERDHPFVIATLLSKLPDHMRELVRATDDTDNLQDISKQADIIWQAGRLRGRGTEVNAMTRETADGICKNHCRFGKNAYTCKPPCKFEGVIAKPPKKGKRNQQVAGAWRSEEDSSWPGNEEAGL